MLVESKAAEGVIDIFYLSLVLTHNSRFCQMTIIYNINYFRNIIEWDKLYLGSAFYDLMVCLLISFQRFQLITSITTKFIKHINIPVYHRDAALFNNESLDSLKVHNIWVTCIQKHRTVIIKYLKGSVDNVP